MAEVITGALLFNLYGASLTMGFLPYRIFAKGGQSYGMTGVRHFPGLDGQQGEVPEALPFHGYMGLACTTYSVPVTDQDVLLCWSAIDIDSKDNSLSHENIVRTCHALAPETIIRTSKSGGGVHMIITCAPRYVKYEHAKEEAKEMVKPYMLKLLQSGINPCVSGLVNLWLWSEGGHQKTLHLPGVGLHAKTARVSAS
jgi:hypothetical protein